jgi:hypothetical protein
MDAEDLSYDADSRIDTITLSKNLKRVKVKDVRQRGERFCASLRLVNNMMILPASVIEYRSPRTCDGVLRDQGSYIGDPEPRERG